MQDVVLPDARDVEVLRGEAEADESVARQDPLRSTVVQQGSGLDSVQAQLLEGHANHGTSRGSRDTATVVGCAYPIAEAARLKRSSLDAVESDASDHPTGVEDDVGESDSLLLPVQRVADDDVLPSVGVVAVFADGFPWGEEVAIDAHQLGKDGNVFEGGEAGGDSHRPMIADSSNVVFC